MNPPIVIGWKERVDFVDWGISRARVKIDTGARTSAIDAVIHEVRQGPAGTSTLVLGLARSRSRPGKIKVVEVPLIGTTRVRSTNGETEDRYVIATTIRLGPVTKRIQLSVANRGRMLVRVILGRTALADDFLVDVSRKYVLSA